MLGSPAAAEIDAHIDVKCSWNRTAMSSKFAFSNVIPAAPNPAVGTVSPKMGAKKSYGAPWKKWIFSRVNCWAIAGLYRSLIQWWAVSWISWYSGSAFGGKK